MSSEVAPWPRMMAPPAEVLTWLSQLRPADAAGKKCVVTLRWLVQGELERGLPEPPPSTAPFTSEEPAQTL